jgi:hypothetical protein
MPTGMRAKGAGGASPVGGQAQVEQVERVDTEQYYRPDSLGYLLDEPGGGVLRVTSGQH